MRNDFDYAHERPSRLSRVLVLLSTLGVALIAAWVFAPILLANYTAYTATVSADAKPPGAVREPVTTASTAIVVPSAVGVPAAPPAAAGTTTALAATSDDAAAQPAPVNVSTRSLIPWPGDSPPPPTASAAPADTASTRLAAVNATIDPVDTAENVPLPRRRPSRAIAAHLAIPLPRPRPEIVSEIEPPSRPTTFDLQIERMR